MPLKSYSKQYKSTLKGRLRKDFETYISEHEYEKESDAMRDLVRAGLESKKEKRFTGRNDKTQME